MLVLLCLSSFIGFTQGNLVCPDGVRIIDCRSRPLRPDNGNQYYTTSVCAIDNVSAVNSVTFTELMSSRSCTYDRNYCNTYAYMEHINSGVFDYMSDRICVGWGCQASFEVCAGNIITTPLVNSDAPLDNSSTHRAAVVTTERISKPSWTQRTTAVTVMDVTTTIAPTTDKMPIFSTQQSTSMSAPLMTPTKGVKITTCVPKLNDSITLPILDGVDTSMLSVVAVGTTVGTFTLSVALGDSMIKCNGMMFSTSDKDNDRYNANCAEFRKGPVWYDYCAYANLNGKYYENGDTQTDGVFWQTWHGGVHRNYTNVRRTKMKIRRL